MTSCKHTTIVLLPGDKNRLRCRHCHLTISVEELGDSHCPECFEASGKRHRDFDEITGQKPEGTTYRCEECGIIIQGTDSDS